MKKLLDYELFNSKDELAINRKNIVKDNYCFCVTDNLINGTLFTGLLILLGAEDTFIGLVTTIRFLGSFFQVLSPLFLEKIQKRKKTLIMGRLIVYSLNIIAIGCISFLNINASIKIYAILAIMLIVSLTGAIIGPGFAVWHIKSIPMSIRNKYFSFLNVTNNIIVFTAAFFAGKLVDFYKNGGSELTGHVIIRVIAVILCVIDIIKLSKVKEYENVKSDIKINLKNVFITPLKEKRYLATVIAGCLWNFSVNITGPYFNIYLIKDMNVSYTTMSLVNMSYLVNLIFFTRLWSKKIEKFSHFKTLRILMSLFLLHYLGMSFVTKGTLWLYPAFSFYAFIFLSGLSLVFASLPFVNIPEKNQTSLIGFYSAMNSLAAFLGIETGNIFIKLSQHYSLGILSIQMNNKQLIMIFTSVVMFCCVLLVYKLEKSSKNAKDIKII